MNQNLQTIFQAFDGKLVGGDKVKYFVCTTLAAMPQALIDQITHTCWFVASFDDAWAFAFTGNDIKDQHLIFLSDDLLNQSDQQIQFTIAHEIGHVILGHKNAIFEHQTKTQIATQEHEANTFALQYTQKP